MDPGLLIRVVDLDPDYLGLEIRAASDRFAGTAFIYAGFDTPFELADQIAGFPARVPEERQYEVGVRRDPQLAGGYCQLRLRTYDKAGHVSLEVTIEDDVHLYSSGVATFSFEVTASAIDSFVRELRALGAARGGGASLEGQSA